VRAVIDTNLLVSAFISRPGSTPRRLLDAVRDGRLKPILSKPLIDEFLDVMSRPKFSRYGITIGAVLDFIDGLLQVGTVVEITGAPRGCQDPDDDAVIETAEVGAADYLITGDSDLLAGRLRARLYQIGIEVVTASDFLPDSLASAASGVIAVEQARMIVAGLVGSAIAISMWQVKKLSRSVDSFLYDAMAASALINQRVTLHKSQLVELANYDESDPSYERRRAALESDIAKTSNLQRSVKDATAQAQAAVTSALIKLRQKRSDPPT